ncbi:MAG: hypothetical protein BWY45_02923 [Euryarchaeota archaeon ADurb.Bin294]|nr:MAG: hypothetical protein BWY45_02923 [Euryarchaeota archaeon ADurb.Bin294]
MLIFAGERPYLCLITVCQHDDGVIMEDMGNGVFVVCEISSIGNLKVPVHVLALDEEEWDPVHKSHDIWTFPVNLTPDPEFPDTEEVVVLRNVKVEYLQDRLFLFVLLIPVPDLYSVFEEIIFLLVCGKESLG